MTTLNEQISKVLDAQKEALEPFRAMGGMAAEAFERVARQNYAVLGDWLEFAVSQARLPGQAVDATDYFTRQVQSAQAFGEKLATRGQEYVAIASAVGAQAQTAASHVVQQAVRRAA